jgi:DnaJ-class molecular chaperone
MRFLVCLLVVSGCVMASMPPDDGLTADLACETARMVTQLRQEIAPTPVSDECENCDGTGKIGDGKIVMTCPVCRGTGKKLKSVCKDCPK